MSPPSSQSNRQEFLYSRDDNGTDTLDTRTGCARKRIADAVFSTMKREMHHGDPDNLFRNIYLYSDASDEATARAETFLKNGGSCALVKHISENPVRIWTRDDDGAAWFNLRVGRAVCCVMLRGAVSGNTVKEIGLMIAFPGCGA